MSMRKNELPNISIIVPVYNAEKTIQRCINSVLQQKWSNWELVLVNDGSRDRSGELCKQASLEYDNIVYIEQANSGVSAARNNGMDCATGEWIMFLDADDELAPNALNLLEGLSEKYDIVIGDNVRGVDGGTVSGNIKNTGREYTSAEIQLAVLNLVQFKKKFPEDTALNDYNVWSCWGRFFRNSLLKEHNITFSKNIKLSEDMLFCYRAYKATDRVWVSDRVIYKYYLTEGSATHRYREDLILNALQVISKLRGEVDKALWMPFRHYVLFQLTQCIWLQYGNKNCPLSAKEAGEAVRDIFSDKVLQEAIQKCDYINLIRGKKNYIKCAYTLFLLKRKQYSLLIASIRSPWGTMLNS